jgi:glycosyltransferase involved in cell wall biosynthesis
LAAADVWCLPSHFENFGLAVAEAMASGRAVVISPGVQIADAVRAEDAAEVLPELSPEALADAVVALLGDPARREQLAERARLFARRYDWSAVAPVLADMYARALGTRESGRAAVAQRSP